MKTAVVFAGQGAQFPGMGRDLAEDDPACRALFDEASGVVGYDVAALCFEGPEEALRKSDHCQPAVFVTSAVCHAALRAACPDLAIEAYAGLSLGEWTALYAAGTLPFAETVSILEARHVPYRQQPAIHGCVDRPRHRPPADRILAYAVFDHIVMEIWQVGPPSHVHLAEHSLAR